MNGRQVPPVRLSAYRGIDASERCPFGAHSNVRGKTLNHACSPFTGATALSKRALSRRIHTNQLTIDVPKHNWREGEVKQISELLFLLTNTLKRVLKSMTYMVKLFNCGSQKRLECHRLGCAFGVIHQSLQFAR